MPETLAKQWNVEIAKVDEELGLVFGFAIVSEQNGKPYIDLQDDYIPPEAMLKAATGFMEQSRQADDSHDSVSHGQIVHSLPLTKEIAESLGIESDRTGWIVGMKPSPEVFELYKSGERKGFSIGGVRL